MAATGSTGRSAFYSRIHVRVSPESPSQVNEFRWMVERFHKYNIEVIIDVVYNHTGEGGLWREKLPLIEGQCTRDLTIPRTLGA